MWYGVLLAVLLPFLGLSTARAITEGIGNSVTAAFHNITSTENSSRLNLIQSGLTAPVNVSATVNLTISWEDELDTVVAEALQRRNIILPWVDDPEIAAVRLLYVTHLIVTPLVHAGPLYPVKLCFTYIALHWVYADFACALIDYEEITLTPIMYLDYDSFEEDEGPGPTRNPHIWPPTHRYGELEAALGRLARRGHPGPWYKGTATAVDDRPVWLFVDDYARSHDGEWSIDMISGTVSWMSRPGSELRAQEINGSTVTNVPTLSTHEAWTSAS